MSREIPITSVFDSNLASDSSRSTDAPTAVPVKLSKEELMELSSVSSLLGLGHICVEWGLILGAIYLCHRFFNPLLYLVAIAFIGARQHALLILMHDGVHYRLFRNRAVNDWVSEVVLAWPHLISARSYRKNHFAHHRFLNTEDDPDFKRRLGDPAWVFPKPVFDLGRLLLRDVSGLNGILLLKLAASLLSADTVTATFLAARYGFYLAALSLIVYAGAFKGLVLFWLIPLFTWLVMIMRVRSIAEHAAIEASEPVYAQTRTTYASWLERIFVAPKNVNFHLEHHFFPAVPFYRLPALHRLLLTKPGFRAGAHLTASYWGVLSEAVGLDAHASLATRAETCDGAPEELGSIMTAAEVSQ